MVNVVDRRAFLILSLNVKTLTKVVPLTALSAAFPSNPALVEDTILPHDTARVIRLFQVTSR
jgi:hypothetical protein